MMSDLEARPGSRRALPWLAAGLIGAVIPSLALLLLATPPARASFAEAGGPILAVGLMGVGMIAAAASGRLWVGVVLAAATGAGLALLAHAAGAAALAHPVQTGLVVLLASVSFAARGALFARSNGARGWWIALGVVAGEAAMLATAAARPDALPDWLLVLLPAQWASAAIRSALAGAGAISASAELIALGGTAAATLLVARLWPRRWPYLVMFGTWLALSALVWHRPAPPFHPAGSSAAQAVAPGSQDDARRSPLP